MFRTTSVHHQERFVQAVRICRLWYVRIQLVQNAPDDEPMRSETCRANLSAE